MFVCDVLETKILDLGIVPLLKIYFKMIQMEKEKWFCSALVCPRTSTNKRSKRTRVHPYQNNVKRKRNLKKLSLCDSGQYAKNICYLYEIKHILLCMKFCTVKSASLRSLWLTFSAMYVCFPHVHNSADSTDILSNPFQSCIFG